MSHILTTKRRTNFFAGLLTGLTGTLVAGFLFSGCLFSKDSEPDFITPLAVGNTWVYVDSVYYPRSSGDDSITVATGETSITGTREVTIEGVPTKVYLSNNHAVDGLPSALSIYVGNVGRSNYNYGAEQDHSFGTEQILGKSLHLEYHTTAGRRYTTLFYGFEGSGVIFPKIDTIEIEVVDPHHTCVTPAGTFTCVKFRGYYTNGDLYATAYHAPGVGNLGSEIVRTELVGDSLREVRYIRRLTSFTLH